MSVAKQSEGIVAGHSRSDGNTQVIFLAMGYPYVVMAINAARSLRVSGTDAHLKLITNLPIRRILRQDHAVFDSVEAIDCETDTNRWIKTSIVHRAEGDRNAFLDCDIEVLAPLNPVLSLLENFDVAARNLPFETKANVVLETGRNILDLSMSEVNTGVVFFKRNAGAIDLFDRWHRNFLEGGHPRDQPSFLKALLEARETRFLALPPMWNATPFKIVDLAQMRRTPDKIRILHYRDPTFWPSVAPRLAAAHDETVFELTHPSTKFVEQREDYAEVARRYRSPLFQHAAGRVSMYLMRRLTKDHKGARIRVYGLKKTPVPVE